MKWILLPLVTTAFSALVFALCLQHKSRGVLAKDILPVPSLPESEPPSLSLHGPSKKTTPEDIPALGESESPPLTEVCTSEDGGGLGSVCSNNNVAEEQRRVSTTTAEDDEADDYEDPSLQQMPNADFKAYVRPDIATFYQKEPASMIEIKPHFRGLAGKFVNLSPDNLALYWDSGSGPPGNFIGYASPFFSYGTATYPGHEFYFAPHGKPNEELCRFTIVQGTSVYFYDPFSKDEHEPGRCVTDKEPRSLDTLNEEQKRLYDASKYNLEFGEEYKRFTGSEWLTQYPRSRPRNKIWDADYFGQEHFVQTKETQFVHLPPENKLQKMTIAEVQRNETDEIALKAYRKPEPVMNMTLTTVSCAPRAFEIKNFLSDVEVDHILDQAKRKNLRASTTGTSGESESGDTRTSKNTWVGRYSSPIIDAVYRRAADVLRMDEALLRHRQSDEYPELGTDQPISEDLQLVHYDVGEQYTAHHDFGFPTGRHPDSPSRFANILLYLNEGMEGGETSFPRWRNAETADAFDVKPEKGKAVIFYMLLPDGNMDDLTQHAALPVKKGEKWLANLWIHDPIKL